jgi:hemerythrin
MELFWTEDLSVGYNPIDTQHKELLTQYNSLLKACKESKESDEIEQLLYCMVDHFASHIEEEEHLMAQFKFPDHEIHTQQHRDFFENVQEVYNELNENGVSVTFVAAINHTLLNWLLNHVMQFDTNLGRFLATQPEQ